jgi:uncharacterized protein (DUF1501 family)
MPFLHSLWQGGQLAVVHDVGYPQPDFSHFESMAIWQTASLDGRFRDGWLGRYLDVTDGGAPAAMRAIALQDGLPTALTSAKDEGIAIGSLSGFGFGDEGQTGSAARHRALASFEALDGRGPQDMWGRVALAEARTVSAVEEVGSLTKAAGAGGGAGGGVARPGQELAVLMGGGLGTEIGWVTVGGFDTHANQIAQQRQALTGLDTVCKDFFTEAASVGIAGRTTVLVFSEFGRRVGDNGSGTDHGSAQPVLVAGPLVRGGFVGSRPDLTALNRGNLVAAVDYRSVYASLLEQVLHTDPDPLLGGSFPRLPLMR